MDMMEIDKYCLVNSKGEAILDEFCDLEPILDELFQPNNNYNQQPAVDIALNSHLSNYNTSSWNPNYINAPQEIMSTKAAASSSSQLISFGNSSPIGDIVSVSPKVINFSPLRPYGFSGKNKNKLYDAAHDQTAANRACTMVRKLLQAHEHVMAERKRRERLNQLYISLSKVLPGLKKLDKASLLGDAIEYVKELQERVRILEEEEAEEADKNPVTKLNANCSTSAGCLIPRIDNDTAPSSSNYKASSIYNGNSTARESVAAEIKARISKKNVLIKILCKNHRGLISRIQNETERLHLNVLDIRAMPFGTSFLDITVLAEIESGFSGTVKAIIDHLQTAFLHSNLH